MKPTHHLQWIELSQTALNKNVAALAHFAGDRIIAASLKANSYGHGIPQIVGMLKDDERVGYVTVHSLEEAIACRDAGWMRNILVLGPIATGDLEQVFVHDIEPVVFTRETINAIGRLTAKFKRGVKTHLKLETGTNRQGITEKELGPFAAIYKKYPLLKRPYGASMHFSNIEDTTSHEYAEYQLGEFNRLTAAMKRHGIAPAVRHTASSAALILFEKTRFEMVRPGLSVYGHWPSKETYLSYRLGGGGNRIFEPVLSWRTRITQLKDVSADSFIGYGCTYRTTSRTRLAILPVGYYDGYSRALSNQSYVLIRGKRAPVRGRICMNLMMVDVTDIKGVRLGDAATLIGRDGDEVLKAERLADWAGTINYEILSRLSQAIFRIKAE